MTRTFLLLTERAMYGYRLGATARIVHAIGKGTVRQHDGRIAKCRAV